MTRVHQPSQLPQYHYLKTDTDTFMNDRSSQNTTSSPVISSSSSSSSHSDSISATTHVTTKLESNSVGESSSQKIQQHQPKPRKRSSNTKVVAGYQLIQKLGSGSFATVYKGVRTSSHEPNLGGPNEPLEVAIKAISKRTLSPKILNNLELEIKILQQLECRNIVRLYNVVECSSQQSTHQRVYLIMEYAGGGDLQKFIRSRRAGRLSEKLCCLLMKDLGNGLNFLWRQQLIHRDIKPQNLLLTCSLPKEFAQSDPPTHSPDGEEKSDSSSSSDFTLKIADFGFARPLANTSLADTLCGSPLYMAPEILQHQRYSAKADLWSTGTVLFEMLTGSPPFNGENHIDLLRNIQRRAVRLPAGVKVSPECVSLLKLLLHRNPMRRGSIHDFAKANEAFVQVTSGNVEVLKPSRVIAPITKRELSFKPLVASPSLTATNAMMINKIPLYKTPKPLDIGPGVLGPTVRHSSIPTISPEDRPKTIEAAAPKSTSNNSSHSSDEFVMVDHHNNAMNKVMPPLHLYHPPTKSHQRNSNNPNSNPAQMRTHGKGILSTSPGTGRNILAMMMSHNKHASTNANGNKPPPPPSSSISPSSSPSNSASSAHRNAANMLAAAEDVGRRAINVAHVGDTRAYLAMQFLLNTTATSSSTHTNTVNQRSSQHLHAGAATVDVEETHAFAMDCDDDDHMSTDDAFPFAAIIEEEGEGEENEEGLSSCIPASSSSPAKASTAGAVATSTNATAAARIHLREALLCYVNALQMMKGAVFAARKVSFNATRAAAFVPKKSPMSSTTASSSHGFVSASLALQERCQVSLKWLGTQFDGILERADAAHEQLESIKLSTSISSNGLVEKANASHKYSMIHKQSSTSSLSSHHSDVPMVSNADGHLTAEELVYNHAMACGKDGAVKQVLGQHEAAIASYKSAGLLIESLLMEQNLVEEDRRVLESYVKGFREQMMELSKVVGMTNSSSGSIRYSTGGNWSKHSSSLTTTCSKV